MEDMSKANSLMPKSDDDDVYFEAENAFFLDIFSKIRNEALKQNNDEKLEEIEAEEGAENAFLGEVFAKIREYRSSGAFYIEDSKREEGIFLEEEGEEEKIWYSPAFKYRKKENIFDVKMIEPELYTQKDTGKDCGVFTIKEGEAAALPIEPKNIYSLNNKEKIDEWRLFLEDSKGENKYVLDYYCAVLVLRNKKGGEKSFIMGEKDGYIIVAPLTFDEIKEITLKSRAFSSPYNSKRADNDNAEDKGEWVDNVEDVKEPYIERLQKRKSLFYFLFILMSFLNAATFIQGRINMSALELLGLFFSSISFSFAVALLSFIAGYFVLLFIFKRLRGKGRKLLSFIGVLCCVEIVGRVLLFCFLRDFLRFEKIPDALYFGVLFSVFGVWKKCITDDNEKPVGKIWRILGVFFALLSISCPIIAFY